MDFPTTPSILAMADLATPMAIRVAATLSWWSTPAAPEQRRRNWLPRPKPPLRRYNDCSITW